jgi:hypothetical protein
MQELNEMNNLMMMCGKEIYSKKKPAKKAAKHLNRVRFGEYGSMFSVYHCKDCQAWHVYTENRAKLRSNSQHSRGGRR